MKQRTRVPYREIRFLLDFAPLYGIGMIWGQLSEPEQRRWLKKARRKFLTVMDFLLVCARVNMTHLNMLGKFPFVWKTRECREIAARYRLENKVLGGRIGGAEWLKSGLI